MPALRLRLRQLQRWVSAASNERHGRQAGAALCRDPEGARHPGLQLRAHRRRARRQGTRQRSDSLECAGQRGSAEAEGDSRVVHHAARRRHRHLVAQRRIPRRHDQPRDRRGHPGRHLGFGRADVAAPRLLRRRRSRVGPHHGRRDHSPAERQGQGRDHQQPRCHQSAEPPGRGEGSAGQGAGHRDRRGLRHPGGFDPLCRDHRHGLASLSRPGGVDLGRRMACLHAKRARRRRFVEDQGHLLRHHRPGARPAPRGQGAGAPWAEVLRLGQRVGETAARHQERQEPGDADHRFRRRRGHEGQRRTVRGAVEAHAGGKLRSSASNRYEEMCRLRFARAILFRPAPRGE